MAGPQITEALDDVGPVLGEVRYGDYTNDNAPVIRVALGDGLAAGETLSLSDNDVAVGPAVTLTSALIAQGYADVPLASRCVKAGAEVIAPTGKPFSEDSIGMALAVRNLMTDLRSSGEITGGPRGFAPRDRSAFLSTLDQTIRRILRAQTKT